jgi:hypothetical protein
MSVMKQGEKGTYIILLEGGTLCKVDSSRLIDWECFELYPSWKNGVGGGDTTHILVSDNVSLY